MYNNNAKYNISTFLQNFIDIAPSFIGTNLGLMIIKQPILNLQINKQVYPTLSNIQIVQNIYNNEGIKSFYKATPISSFKVIVTECYRGPLMIAVPKYIDKYFPFDQSPYKDLTLKLGAAPLIALIDATIICPLTRLSTHQQTTKYKLTLNEVIKDYAKTQFIKELYAGYSATLLQTSIHWSSFFLIDHYCKSLLVKNSEPLSYSSVAIASIGSGVLQTFINIIPDTIRAQMQKSQKNGDNIYNITKYLVNTYGMKAFTTALPHKLSLGIINFTSKSLLNTFWNDDLLLNESEQYSLSLDFKQSFIDAYEHITNKVATNPNDSQALLGLEAMMDMNCSI